MIYRIIIHGNINNRMEQYVDFQLNIALRNRKVGLIILDINSGGGSASSSEMIYDSVLRADKLKPVVATVTGAAASGAYMIACACRKIYCIKTAILGSVGAISISPDVTELLKKIGVKVNVYSKGEKKGTMNPFVESSEKIDQEQRQLLDDIYEIFMDIVISRRHLSGLEIEEVGKSGVYTGKRALELHLTDFVMSYGEIIDQLRSTYQQAGDPVTMERKTPFIFRFISKFFSE
jgi:protease-4